jgi:hypothetical protein
MRDEVVFASILSIPCALSLVAVCRLWNSWIWSSLFLRFLTRLGNSLLAHGLATSSSMACTRVVGAGAFGSSFSLRSMMCAGSSHSAATSSIAGEILSTRGIALRGSNLSVASAVSFDDTASIRNSVRLGLSLPIASFVNCGSSLSAGPFVRAG